MLIFYYEKSLFETFVSTLLFFHTGGGQVWTKLRLQVGPPTWIGGWCKTFLNLMFLLEAHVPQLLKIACWLDVSCPPNPCSPHSRWMRLWNRAKPHVSVISSATLKTSARLHAQMSMHVAPEIAKSRAGTTFSRRCGTTESVSHQFEQCHCRQWGATFLWQVRSHERLHPIDGNGTCDADFVVPHRFDKSLQCERGLIEQMWLVQQYQNYPPFFKVDDDSDTLQSKWAD